MNRPRIFSGAQPTGNPHLGNYLGSFRNWVEQQQTYENFFCIVDLHAMTVPHDPQALSVNSRQLAALYIACGIDPQGSTIFLQSQVSAHAELAWLLNCITPLNWLTDMIQYKEKAERQGEKVGTGLLDYPVLMAADILLYQTDVVPVGEDQKQHLELTRDIANTFNHLFGREAAPIFKLPQPLIRAEGKRVMSLTDGSKKMSKSDPSDLSRINLLDSPEEIAKKIKRCKTDPIRGLEFDNPERPEANNLLGLYQIFSGQTKAAVAAECADLGWGQFKPLLTEVLITSLAPIRERYAQVMNTPGYLDDVLKQGRLSAEAVAQQTLQRAKQAMGLLLA